MNWKKVSLVAAWLALCTAGTTQAANITVDESTCTLADAIASANTDIATGGCTTGSGDDTITLQTDVTLAATLPEIFSAITIEGGGHFISGNNNSAVGKVLDVTHSGNLTLNETTIKEGKNTSRSGGGIYNYGTVTLTNSTVRDCFVSIEGGGFSTAATAQSR